MYSNAYRRGSTFWRNESSQRLCKGNALKGLAVEDGSEIQKVKMTDRPVSGYFESWMPRSLSVSGSLTRIRSWKKRSSGQKENRFSYGGVAGAGLALYRARRNGPEGIGNQFPGTVWKRRKKRLQAGRHSMNRTGNRRLQPNG